MLKKHRDKLNNESYSIGISKHVPNNSANLAFMASPEVTSDNISIIKEKVGLDSSEEYNERDNLHYAKSNSSLITETPNQDILVTDEFTIKRYPDEVPEPLFYKATLKGTMNSNRFLTNNKFVPYQYGYSLKTEDTIKAEQTLTSKADITPLVYKETYENGYNNILNITTDDGSKVLSGFKIRMIQQTGFEYSVEIYNNFDQDKVYKVTYVDFYGNQITEVIESTLLFTGVSYEEFLSKLGSSEYWMAREYAVKQEGKNYEVYAPTQMMNITDENRKPFEFKYRVLANLKENYSKSFPAKLNVGIVYLNGGVSEDVHASLVAFVQSIGTIFPEYVSLDNPHPPLRYISTEQYTAPDYWDVDLSAPQDYINDYDIIFITGYGSHDLSAFNEKVSKYLKAGGKIVIDNLSNDPTEILNVQFGSEEPVVSYLMDTPLETGTREFRALDEYRARHYELSNFVVDKILYATPEGVAIQPQITLTDEDAGEWEDIIRYNSGARSIAVKTYKGRGKIILSNCGLMKAFSHGSYIEAKRFMVNMVLTLSEDQWKVTPWIYDRVYHKNQLYKHEYAIENYVADINPLGGNTIIAKKILSSKVKDLIAYYTKAYSLAGRYYVEAFERNVDKEFVPLNNVYLPASNIEDTPLDENMPLYVFARSTNNTSFNIGSIDGYEDSNIYPYSAPVEFKVAIIPYTFRWVIQKDSEGNDTNVIIQEKLLPEDRNMAKLSFTINKDEGSVNLGLLNTMLPQLPSGLNWANKDRIFFRIEVSAAEDLDGKFVNPSENRVNINLYDKFSGEYIYSSDSDNIIPYSLLYEWRDVEKYDGRTIERQRYNDIILQASTNYYELVASKRVYAVVSNVTRTNAIKLPDNLNTNESWFPKIRYMRFSKTSFDKEDYDRISKTIGFRFDKEYIIEKALEYFGEDPTDDKVADIIGKLSGDERVDINDIAILAEAFDIMDEEASYEYDIQEYFSSQVFDEYPYKSVRDEYTKYLTSRTLQVQYTPMNVLKGLVEGEVLQQLAPVVYRSENENWVPALPVRIEMETESTGVWETITSGYVIDFANGLVIFEETPERSIRASYNYTNLKIIKKTYTNVKASLEKLKKLQDKTFMASNMINKRILRTPNPVLVIKHPDGRSEPVLPGAYSIDYDTGLVTTKETLTGTMYMTYSYSNIEYLEIKDYDAKHGIIELARDVHFNDNIYASYSYREDYYEYKGYFDSTYVDPITGEIGRYIYVDLNPTRGHECTYPIVTDENNVAYQEIPTYKLLGKTMYVYMLPYRITRNGITTEESSTVRHTFSESELTLLQVAHPELIVLGSIKLINNYTVYDVTTLDTRKRGGGLKENISNEKIEKFDELSLNLWDIVSFDGRSYHPNGITVIKLPKTILIENGGKFSQEDIDAIVEQHVAFGVMPVIRYY